MFDSQAHGQRFGWLRMAILMVKNCTGFQSKMLGVRPTCRCVVYFIAMECNAIQRGVCIDIK